LELEYEWILEADGSYEVPYNLHDRGYKYLLEIKRMFVQLMRSFVDQGWVQKLDEEHVERIDKSFVSKDFSQKEADLVYRVRLDGQDVFFYLLLELQSTVDFQMPYRLLQYMLEIWRAILLDTEKKAVKRKDFKLPVVVPCVLYNGKNNWTVCQRFREMLEGNELFGEYVLDFKYILFDVNRYDEEKLINLANVISAAFFMDKRRDSQEFVGELKKILNHMGSMNSEDFTVFATWVKNILVKGLPEESAKQVEEIMAREEEAEDMIYGIEVALKKERRKERREGKIEGRIEDILEWLGQIGNVPEELEQHIKVQKDVDTLRTWLKWAARAESVEEFIDKVGMN
jgi:hypothetical protein